MSKKDWQYENLAIDSQEIEAIFAYWMVRHLVGIPWDFTNAQLEFFSSILAERKREERYASQAMLELVLHRALKRCGVVHHWIAIGMFTQSIKIEHISIALAEMLWRDACAKERIRELEAKRPWWDRLFDWIH
jgi:hypothetical protein